MPYFEVNIVCSDGEACFNFVKEQMEDFSEIVSEKNHPFGHTGKIFARDYRDMVRIVNDLKKNVSGAIENISVKAIEPEKN